MNFLDRQFLISHSHKQWSCRSSPCSCFSLVTSKQIRVPMKTEVRIATYNVCFETLSVLVSVASEDPLLVLRRHWGLLLDCFKSSPTNLVGVLYEKRFISTDTRDRVTDTRETAEKAAILLAEVQRVIGACSGADRRVRFQEFFHVVKDHPAVAGSQLKGIY